MKILLFIPKSEFRNRCHAAQMTFAGSPVGCVVFDAPLTDRQNKMRCVGYDTPYLLQTTAPADGDIQRAPWSHRDPSGHRDRSTVANADTRSALPWYLDDARQGESSRHAPTHSIQSP